MMPELKINKDCSHLPSSVIFPGLSTSKTPKNYEYILHAHPLVVHGAVLLEQGDVDGAAEVEAARHEHEAPHELPGVALPHPPLLEVGLVETKGTVEPGRKEDARFRLKSFPTFGQSSSPWILL